MKITTKHASNSPVTFVTQQRFAILFFLPAQQISEKWYIIIWLQYYAHSNWLLSGHYFLYCNYRALLSRWPKHIQSVFNLIVDILMDIHIMVNWQLSKRYPLTSVTWLYRALSWRLALDNMEWSQIGHLMNFTQRIFFIMKREWNV